MTVSSTYRWLHRLIHLSLMVVLISGCTFTMEGNIEKKPEDETSEVKHHQKTINATSYSNHEKMITLCENRDDHVARIRFHTNAGFILASIFSLGFYVPQHVEWWCGPSKNNSISEEPWRPEDDSD